MSDENTAAAAEVVVPEQRIQILKGEPTAEELAALVTVLAAASGGAGESAAPDKTRWGLPVDNLRFAPFSWQITTLRERAHMRR